MAQAGYTEALTFALVSNLKWFGAEIHSFSFLKQELFLFALVFC